MERTAIATAGFRTAFVLILVVAVSVLFLAVTWPFLKPLLVGAILADLFQPLYNRMLHLVRGRPTLADC
jgi:predicted PurR-regulated permease PerM